MLAGSRRLAVLNLDLEHDRGALTTSYDNNLTFIFRLGQLRCRVTRDPKHVARAQRMRARCFGCDTTIDVDPFDDECQHVLIEDVETNQLLCCFRLLSVPADRAARSYSAQFYDLAELSNFGGSFLELGRFCKADDALGPDVLRAAFAIIARQVDMTGAAMLFGCSSFWGVEPAEYAACFGHLSRRHTGTLLQSPGAIAPEVIDLSAFAADNSPNKEIQRQMPALLRHYLGLGAWVGNQAVIDRSMNTIHVFTGVEIAHVPERRQRTLRAVAELLETASSTAT